MLLAVVGLLVVIALLDDGAIVVRGVIFLLPALGRPDSGLQGFDDRGMRSILPAFAATKKPDESQPVFDNGDEDKDNQSRLTERAERGAWREWRE